MLVAAHAAKIAVKLLVQIDPGNIFHPHQLCGFTLLAAHALDDDIFELLGVGQPAQGVDRELEGLIGRHRRGPQLPGHHLDVLLLDGVHHIQGGQVVILELVRVQPDPHAVGTGAEHLDLAHPGQTAQGVLQVDDGVVGEKGGIISAHRRSRG